MTEKRAGLLWQPLYPVLHELTAAGDPLNLIVAPFIKLAALQRLFEGVRPTAECKVVSRWRPSDVLTGVSDLGVYTWLQERGWSLYVNERLHMKLYAFESNRALVTSGNLTLKGLGYIAAEASNIEVGKVVDLQQLDWLNLYRVISESRLITPEIYGRFVEYVDAQGPPPRTNPHPDLLGTAKQYTLASLPASESPDSLWDFYHALSAASHPPEAARRGYHDLATFQISDGLTREAFHGALEVAWRANPFVNDFVSYLRQEGSLRFGAVNAWIHEKCEDVPLPYRWEVKDNTRIFYNWLTHYFSEVTWDRPNYSQVIYWTPE